MLSPFYHVRGRTCWYGPVCHRMQSTILLSWGERGWGSALRRRRTISTFTLTKSVHDCVLLSLRLSVNASDSKGNYSATLNNTKLVYWPLMGGLLQLIHRGGDWAGPPCQISRLSGQLAPPSTLLSVPNVTAHPSTASVPITVLLYDGPLLCGFNVAIKGLRQMLIMLSYPFVMFTAA